jgi:hypothetical protein
MTDGSKRVGAPRAAPIKWPIAPLRRRVSGPSKAAVEDALKELRKDIDGGITKPGSGSYTVRVCCEDWLAGGLLGHDPATAAKSLMLRVLECRECHDARFSSSACSTFSGVMGSS